VNKQEFIMQLFKAQQIVFNFGAQYCLGELHDILAKMREAHAANELFNQEVRAMRVVTEQQPQVA
jgi:hypothetical protein